MSSLPLKKSDVRFLLLEGIHASAVSFLKDAGFSNVEYFASSLSEDELKDKISEVHVVGIRSRTIM